MLPQGPAEKMPRFPPSTAPRLGRGAMPAAEGVRLCRQLSPAHSALPPAPLASAWHVPRRRPCPSPYGPDPSPPPVQRGRPPWSWGRSASPGVPQSPRPPPHPPASPLASPALPVGRPHSPNRTPTAFGRLALRVIRRAGAPASNGAVTLWPKPLLVSLVGRGIGSGWGGGISLNRMNCTQTPALKFAGEASHE